MASAASTASALGSVITHTYGTALHGFAGVLGGMTDAPHGALCAALLGPVCEANLARGDARLVGRFGHVAACLTGIPEATPEDGLHWIEHTRALFQIPGLSPVIWLV